MCLCWVVDNVHFSVDLHVKCTGSCLTTSCQWWLVSTDCGVIFQLYISGEAVGVWFAVFTLAYDKDGDHENS